MLVMVNAFGQIDALQASEIALAVAVRDFLRAQLPIKAQSFVDLYNAEVVTADERVALPGAISEDACYLWEPNSAPPMLPSIQSFITAWEWYNLNNEIRDLEMFVVYISGIEQGDKIAIAHGLVEEALIQILKKPQAMLNDGRMDVFRFENVATQFGMSDQLGYQLGGGSTEPEPTPMRETVLTCRLLKQDLLEDG